VIVDSEVIAAYVAAARSNEVSQSPAAEGQQQTVVNRWSSPGSGVRPSVNRCAVVFVAVIVKCWACAADDKCAEVPKLPPQPLGSSQVG